ncbi:YceI family protein [soil metagenome]
MRAALAILSLAALAACSKPAEKAAPAPVGNAAPTAPAMKNTAPAGIYTLDPAHSSLNFRVSHMGLSRFTARFIKFGGTLNFDPGHPEAMSVSITIDPASIQTNYPLKDVDFDAQIRGKDFLESAKHPAMTYVSTKVEQTGPNTARVTGDLNFRGVTKPVVLETTFNGGYAPNNMDPSGARIGFSGHGGLKRSDFGFSTGIPAPGTTMGVGDEVEILIETEFTKK